MLKRKNHILAAAAVTAMAPLAAKAATVSFSYVNVQISASSTFSSPTTLTPVFDGTNWDISVPTGDFVRFGVRAAIASPDVNPAHTAAGTPYEQQNPGNTQPATLGLDTVAFQFTDSNNTATGASPLASGGSSTATVNALFNAATNKGNVNTTNGTVGDSPSNQLGGGVFNPDSTTATGRNQIQIGVNATVASNNIFTTLGYTRPGGSAVTLTPSIPNGTLSFVKNTSIGTPSSGNPSNTSTFVPAKAPTYASRLPTGSDSVTALAPLLITSNIVTGGKVISLTAAANSPGSVSGTAFAGTYNPNAPTPGKINVVGTVAGGYVRGELNGIGSNIKTGSTGIRFETAANGTSDPGTEYIGLNIADTSAGTFDADIQALVSEINSAANGLGGGAFATKNTATSDSLANAPASEQFAALGLNAGKAAGFYDIVIAIPSVNAGDGFLGLDLTEGGSNPASLSTLSVTDIAAVPEPASVAGLLIGSAGLLMGRRKRKA